MSSCRHISNKLKTLNSQLKTYFSERISLKLEAPGRSLQEQLTRLITSDRS